MPPRLTWSATYSPGGRVSSRLEERFEDLDGTPVQLYNGPDRRIISD